MEFETKANRFLDDFALPTQGTTALGPSAGRRLREPVRRPIREASRTVSIYEPRAAFDLIPELDHLTRRAIDRNVFFAPQFLVPAMPRLDERKVRLMVVRDEGEGRSRLRFLMPFSVEQVGLSRADRMIRVWSHPFGRLGTPLVDSDDPDGTIAGVLARLADPDLGLPSVLVLPDLKIDRPFAERLVASAEALGLPIRAINEWDRAALGAEDDFDAYMARILSPRRRREIRRQRRLLEARGAVEFHLARDPAAVRHALEDFLRLEAGGWKGRERSALLMDRYRAAFAREAVDALAEADGARVHTLRLDGRPIASLVMLTTGGEAFAWKSAYDERFSRASPGLHLMIEATRALIADPHITSADSCAMPDHFVMNRLWKERVRLATLVVGLRPGTERRVEHAANWMRRQSRSSNLARLMRERLKSMIGFG